MQQSRFSSPKECRKLHKFEKELLSTDRLPVMGFFRGSSEVVDSDIWESLGAWEGDREIIYVHSLLK